MTKNQTGHLMTFLKINLDILYQICDNTDGANALITRRKSAKPVEGTKMIRDMLFEIPEALVVATTMTALYFLIVGILS